MTTLTPSFEPFSLTLIALAFAAAGLVKGVVGFGLPTVSLALLTLAFGLPAAMALMLVPALLTNVWQAVSGGALPALLRQLGPFMLAALASVFIGVAILVRVDPTPLTALLGALVIVYALYDFFAPPLTLAPRWRHPIGVPAGIAGGVLTGMTGAFIVPGIIYLRALGLPRDRLIQAMGLLFTALSAVLLLALSGRGLVPAELGLLSAAAVAPTALGMAVGQRLRGRLSETRFRRFFFVALLLVGARLIVRSLG